MSPARRLLRLMLLPCLLLLGPLPGGAKAQPLDSPNGWVSREVVEAAICQGPVKAAGLGEISCPRPAWYPGPPGGCEIAFRLDPAGRTAAIIGRYFAPFDQALIRYDGCEGVANSFGGAVILDVGIPGQPRLAGFLPGAAYTDCILLPAEGRPGLQEPLCIIRSPQANLVETRLQRVELTPQGARARDIAGARSTLGLGAERIGCSRSDRLQAPVIVAFEAVHVIDGQVRVDVLYIDEALRQEACRVRWQPPRGPHVPRGPNDAYVDPKLLKRGRMGFATGPDRLTGLL